MGHSAAPCQGCVEHVRRARQQRDTSPRRLQMSHGWTPQQLTPRRPQVGLLNLKSMAVSTRHRQTTRGRITSPACMHAEPAYVHLQHRSSAAKLQQRPIDVVARGVRPSTRWQRWIRFLHSRLQNYSFASRCKQLGWCVGLHKRNVSCATFAYTVLESSRHLLVSACHGPSPGARCKFCENCPHDILNMATTNIRARMFV